MRILIAERSRVTRRLMCNELEAAGYRVQETGTAEQALQWVAEARPDLLILDVTLGEPDGFATCERIRAMELLADGEELPRLPIVFATGHDTPDVRTAGFDAGAADFLFKPLQAGAVRRTVDALLRPAAVRQRLTALVAEESPLIRRLTGAALDQLGLAVRGCGDGREALDVLRATPDAFDLVVTDYLMPHMDGDRLCRHIRSNPATAALPVLVVTGAEAPDTIQRILSAGANAVLPKPYVKEDFQARVVALLAHHPAAAQLRQRLAGLDATRATDPAGDPLLTVAGMV